MTRHYANLSNGLLCAPVAATIVRIPSTWCEQKLWDKIIFAVGADLLAHAAAGNKIIVHDQSERQRLTRAQWQGLAWLRFACAMAWKLEPAMETVCRRGRGDMPTNDCWLGQWRKLPESAANVLKHFRPIAKGSGVKQVRIEPCGCGRIQWNAAQTGESIRQAWGLRNSPIEAWAA